VSDGPDVEALRAELDGIALAGGGFRALVEHLAGVLDRRIRWLGADGRLLVDSAVPGVEPALDFVAPVEGGLTPDEAIAASTAPAGTVVRCTDGVRGEVLAVASGRRRAGLLLVEVDDERPVPTRAVAAAATALAIEAGRRDLRKAAAAESGAWLVGELRYGSRRTPQDLAGLARRIGLDVDGDHAALALSYDGSDRAMWDTSLSWLGGPVLVEGARAWTVVTGDVAAEAARHRDRLAGFLRDGEVVAALGPVVRGASATRGSFAVAAHALALLEGQDRPAPDVYDGLDLEGLLVSVPEERLAAYVDHHLGPLLEHTALLDTLEAWLVTGGSRAGVARLVAIHRNSVGHRMDRIRGLLAVDPGDPVVARDLAAAMAARRALAAVRRSEA
jgi:hypothetical protein